MIFARIADDKKAEEIVILEVKEVSFIADFFVICSGLNSRQLQGIADEVELKMKEYGIYRSGIEGYAEAKWILIDYGDVVLHLFCQEMRHFYDLELLWGDAPKIPWRTPL
ncbi:MAG: ribosome silencing factor [Candidatus Kuenenia stuttgartiensis]|nr:ribosome silencing factor [Planctomycetia bacterium]MBW7942588.1 ribosome silencing factor [Candidatus Kuenenia stuttgartiensis]MCF6151216.1 ribosome silencing factor [Candidatus Kuenenia stuttgartiensis]TVM02322.1 MAG: ribosome silencing factor [Candidatus Kuenenia stuttgartiensis]